MEKNVVITVGVDKASLQETNKTIGEVYANIQEASNKTKVVVDANTASSADAVTELTKHINILMGTATAFVAGNFMGGPVMGTVAAAAYTKLAYSAKAKEDEPMTVPFSDLEAVKSNIKLYVQEKGKRIKHFGEFSKKRIDSEYDVTLGNLALLQQENDKIADVMSKLNVKTDMPRILALKEMLEAVNIQADTEVNFFRTIKAFKEKKEKEVKEVGKSALIPNKPANARTQPTVEINPLPVKKGSDVVGLISTQMKDVKLATVELGKSFQQTGRQASQALNTMAHDASKAGMSLQTISNTGAMVGKAIAQGLESSTGQLKAVLKNILTLFLDFLEKQLLEAEAAATLRTLFGDFSAIAQIAAGVAAIELAKAAVNSFAQGGWINEPIVGRGLRSGQMYTLGERGPEYVMPYSKALASQRRSRFPTLAIAA